MKAPCLIIKRPHTVSVSKESNEAWEIDRRSVHLISKLKAGQTQFSDYEDWMGVWNGTTEVAVKVIRSDASEFLKEANFLKKLRHLKVIQLYAVCTQEEPIYIITELMKHGSLLEYLRGDGHALRLPQLIDMGAQVAAGMAYLEKKCYIHRNLAANNILVGEHHICKISDFTFAQVLDDEAGIYESPKGEKVRIKWTAPEGLLYSHFTIKSDVWSFGILLYELITYGRFPYPGMNNPQTIESVVNGYRMKNVPRGSIIPHITTSRLEG